MTSVLITGANRGLGFEFARQYAADGARVYATCRSPDGARDLVALKKEFPDVSIHALTAGDAAQAKALAGELSENSIDILINNAGVVGPENQSFGNLDYDAFRQALDINVLGPTQISEAFLPHVEHSDKKTIVTITSGMGSIADSSGGSYVYRTSKAAVNMVMHNLALDVKSRGIICVVMNPGWVQTDMGGPRASITPEESIRGLRSVIAGLTLEDSGKFLDYRPGKTFPW
jgi:NAD(P)-dependent dehydrogenase (short-subunit alcohol dehydrogenase family)